MKTCDQLQTMAVAYAEICRGEDPWIALGNFMNDWFDYAKDRREQLVTEPLSIPEPLTLDLHRWAAFCAASVEWLCQRYTVACPPWVHDPIYTLSTPWFYPLVLSHSQFYLSKSTGSVQAAALCWLQGGGEGLRMKGGKHNDGLSSFADIETETARSKGHGRSQEASLSVSHPGITGSAHCMRGTAADPTSSRDFDFWLDRVPHLCRSLRFRDALFLNNQDRK